MKVSSFHIDHIRLLWLLMMMMKKTRRGYLSKFVMWIKTQRNSVTLWPITILYIGRINYVVWFTIPNNGLRRYSKARLNQNLCAAESESMINYELFKRSIINVYKIDSKYRNSNFDGIRMKFFCIRPWKNWLMVRWFNVAVKLANDVNR